MTYHDPLIWAEAALAGVEPEHAWRAIRSNLARLGLGEATFVFAQPTGTNGIAAPARKFGYFLHEEWDRRVHDDPVIAMGDPIAKRFFVGESILHVERGNELYQSMPDREQRFYDHYDEFGIRAGTVWPVHDRKAGLVHLLVTWTKGERRGYIDATTRFGTEIHLAITYFSEALRVRQLADKPFPPMLSPRERECMLWVHAGQSTKQIGDKLKISEHTVNEYVASVMQKLDASSRTQAAARATMLGLIRP